MAYAQYDENGIVYAVVDSSKPIPGALSVPYDTSILGKKWNGSAFEDVPKPPAPIPTVSAWQIRKGLNALGLRAAVEAAVASADQNTKDAWQYAKEFERDHPLVISLAAAIGKTSEELDALFSLSATL